MDDVAPPPIPVQSGIAEAVHQAVAEFTGTGGYGHCYLYALTGWALAREVLGRDYRLQAGSLWLLARPPDGWLYLNACPGGLESGSFHCWFGRPGADGRAAELVDLAARHYRAWADKNERLGPSTTVPVRWAWPAGPPDYVWLTQTRSTWLALVADRDLTRRYAEDVHARAKDFAPVVELARRRFQEAAQ
jgi:hypothetical protein